MKSGEVLQKEVCMEKQLSLSEFLKSEMGSGDSEQADEVIDGHWCSQLTAVYRNMVGCSEEGFPPCHCSYIAPQPVLL